MSYLKCKRKKIKIDSTFVRSKSQPIDPFGLVFLFITISISQKWKFFVKKIHITPKKNKFPFIFLFLAK